MSVQLCTDAPTTEELLVEAAELLVLGHRSGAAAVARAALERSLREALGPEAEGPKLRRFKPLLHRARRGLGLSRNLIDCIDEDYCRLSRVIHGESPPDAFRDYSLDRISKACRRVLAASC